MSPVLNTTPPIGNAITPVSAPLPVQALQPLKPFELVIPAVSVAGESAPAPTQIAPGKMLNVEGSTPADTAIPADVIPAHAIELLNASAMREESPVDVSAEENLAPVPLSAATQTAKPRWVFECYLPANPTPVSRFVKPEPVETSPDGEPQFAADVQDELPVEPIAKGATKPKPESDVQPELKLAKKQAETSVEGVVPQVTPAVVAYAPPVIIAPVASEPKTVVSSAATSTPVARQLPAKPIDPVTLPAAIAPPPAVETGEAIAQTVARETLLASSLQPSPKLARADGYAFVRTSVKVAIETSASVARSVKETVFADRDTQAIAAPTDMPAQIPPVDPHSGNASLGSIDGIKIANPLAELSHTSHVAQRHLDLARDTQWLDGLARDIVAASDRSGSMSFRLSPANLGELDVALQTGDTGISVMVKTSSDEAAKIVAAAQPALVDHIQSQGVRVVDAQVMSQTDMSRQGQSQRQAPASFIETGSAASSEPETQDNERPRGRFA